MYTKDNQGKEVTTMTIYLNGKITTYENIFDLLEEKGVCSWIYASTELIGRNLEKVLNEWVNTNKTYYYISGKRYNFELK